MQHVSSILHACGTMISVQKPQVASPWSFPYFSDSDVVQQAVGNAGNVEIDRDSVQSGVVFVCLFVCLFCLFVCLC